MKITGRILKNSTGFFVFCFFIANSYHSMAQTSADTVPANSIAQLDIRLTAIEEQLRELRGRTEENDNRISKLLDAMEKSQKDIDFRFNELSSSGVAKTEPKSPLNTAPTTLDRQAEKLSTTAVAPNSHPQDTAKTSSDTSSGETSFSSPREHYNYAFRLLNQTQYEQSASSFEAFTKKYPKDALVGNAYYWEGETYYIRRDYVNSADNFRKGYEALPEGPKAADNLLKLAMSLNNLSRDKEACLVLQQVDTKFKKSSSSIVDKAYQEQKRIGCKPS